MSTKTAVGAIDEKDLVEGTSLWKDAWKRLLKNRLAMLGGILLAIIIILALWLVKWAPNIARFLYPDPPPQKDHSAAKPSDSDTPTI